MESLGHAISAENPQSSLALSSDEDCALSAQSETGTPPSKSRKKVKRYRLKKSLTVFQVDQLQRLLGWTLDDFEEIKPKKKRAEDAPKEPHQAAFFVFWHIYPRRDIIGAAMKAWKQLAPDAATVEMIIRDVKARCQSADWRKDGGKWIPYAHTYLANQRWLDKGVVNNEIIKRSTVV